jgi:nucleoside-diphosphate-sugar epimerase
MDRVLITGATGFIGSGLVKKWHNDGIDLVAVGRNPEKINKLKLDNPGIHTALFNNELIPIPPVNSVVHIAAQKYVNLGETNPITTIESNINLTLDVLHFVCFRLLMIIVQH